MYEGEIDYGALIDRSIRDFRPATKLWPVSARLALWIFLELGLLALCASINGSQGVETLVHSPRALITIGVFTLVSVAAGLLALRSAIPAREPRRAEIIMVLVGFCAAFAVMG